jgi:plasmid stabilization system protein ParE
MNIQNIVALEQVAHDLNAGEDFYERQNMGLGKYFRDSILSDIESLWLYGGIHQKVYGLYRLLSKRFPYAIYYDINDATIIVFAVLDLRQNPKNISKFISGRNSSALKT